MDDDQILAKISALVEAERTLREKRTAGELSEAHEHRRLRSAEIELDQCWDLLRQRRARVDAGRSPGDARPRDASVVENYWQ